MVLFREGNVYVELIAGHMSDDLILKAGDKLAGAELEIVVFALAAGKSNAVNKAFVVDNSDIVNSGRAIGNFDLTCVAATGNIHLRVDVCVGNLLFVSGNFDTLIILDLNGRIGVALSLENNALVVDLFNVVFGTAHELNACFLNSSVKSVGNGDLKSVLVEYALTVDLFYHALGSLTAAEAGNVELADILLVGSYASLFKALLVYSEFNFNLILFEVGNFY